jgi:hypothetical protein
MLPLAGTPFFLASRIAASVVSSCVCVLCARGGGLGLCVSCVYVCVCVRARANARAHACMHACMHMSLTHTRAHTHTHTHTHTCTCTHICVCVCVCVCETRPPAHTRTFFARIPVECPHLSTCLTPMAANVEGKRAGRMGARNGRGEARGWVRGEHIARGTTAGEMLNTQEYWNRLPIE